MINDLLRGESNDNPDRGFTEDEAVQIGQMRYKAVYDALDDVKEPYALLILADGGLHCVDNSEDVGAEKLARIFVNFAFTVAEVVAEEKGEAAVNTLLMDAVMIAKGTNNA